MTDIVETLRRRSEIALALGDVPPSARGSAWAMEAAGTLLNAGVDQVTAAAEIEGLRAENADLRHDLDITAESVRATRVQ